MAASGPTIIAKFIADTSKMSDEVDKASNGAASSLKSMASKAALAIGGAFAVDQVVQFGKASVDAAMADAEAQATLAQTLRNVTGATDSQIASAEDYISNLSKQTAIADDDLRPAMDKLVVGFKDQEQAQKALAIATDVSAGTGKDLATVTSAMEKAALGSTGALSKLGIETKNADGSAKSLDEIMASMSETFSGQAATSAESAAGQMRLAKIQFGEFQEQVGAKLIPIIVTLADIFTNTLLPAASAIADWIGSHLPLIESLGIGLAAVGVAILIGLVPAFIAWATAAGAAAIATLAATWPLILIGVAVAALAYLIISNWDTIKAVTLAVWNAIVGALSAAWDAIKAAASAVVQWVVDKWNAMSAGIGIVVGWIGDRVQDLIRGFGLIKDAATAVWSWVTGRFQALADFIGNIVGSIAGAVGRIVDAIKTPINAILGAWNGISFGVPEITLPSVEILGQKFGGQSFGGFSIDFPNLPLLAGGGVLTSPTLFIGGEAGTEIVSPEAMLRAIVAEESGGSYVLNLYTRTADASDVAYAFSRLELMAGVT